MSTPEHRNVAFLALAAFVSAATLRALDPLVPAIAREFATTPGTVGLAVTAFALAYGVCQLFWGPVGDRFGKYRVVTLACLLSAATVGAAAFARSLPLLAALRLLSGITAAAIIPLSMAFIGDHVAYDRRQAALARFLAGQIMGLVGGQAVGGIVGDQLGWRAVFVLLSLLFLVAGLLLARELRAGRLPPPVLTAARGPGRLAGDYLRLVRKRPARLVLLVVFLEGCLFFGGFAYAGTALGTRFGLDLTVIGALLAVFGLGGLAYVLAAGRLVAALGERGLAGVGGTILASGFLVLSLAPAVGIAGAAIGVLGLGFYMLHGTLQTRATQMAPEARGLAVSAFAASFFLGQAVGAWAGGLVFDRFGSAALFGGAAPGLLWLGWRFARAARPAA